jgi:hypothetical protein
MLIAKDLPKFLWAEAINYAMWLKNRLPSRAIPGTTPYELVHKTKPSLAQAHEFGFIIYVHLLDAGKLDPRAEEAVFVGVDIESKGYRVYWPLKCRVSIERNVTFMPGEVVVAPDVLDEGESNGQTINENATACTVQTIQPQTTPPTPTPEQDEPHVTHTRHAPGYYAKLQKGEVASIAIESLLEVSELNLLDEVAHIECALAAAEPEPTLAQALNSPDAVEWQEAINYEIGQLEKLETWEIVNAPRGANVIPCHFILATKCRPDDKKLKL